MTTELHGKRILIVEDEYFIAACLRDALKQADAEVVGPAGQLDEAMKLAEQDVDIALVDVNLDGSMSFALADRLAERAVPYIFVTGYDDWALPTAYRDAPRIAKPFDEAAVLARIGAMIGEEAAS